MTSDSRTSLQTSVALVTCAVEVEVGTWGPGCTIQQAVDQGGQEAKKVLLKALAGTSARVLKVQVVQVISKLEVGG